MHDHLLADRTAADHRVSPLLAGLLQIGVDDALDRLLSGNAVRVEGRRILLDASALRLLMQADRAVDEHRQLVVGLGLRRAIRVLIFVKDI